MASDACRDCLCPVVLTRGADQQPMSTKFDMRTDPGVIRNYGKMLVSLAAVVPDGVVCFFVSYRYMDSIIAKWHDMGILQVCLGRKGGGGGFGALFVVWGGGCGNSCKSRTGE